MTNDPRERLGLKVEPDVVPPFELVAAKRDGSGNDGGTLDIGIIARLPNGEKVVIGEIWAACPGSGEEKVRIDARRVAQAIVDTLNGAEG